MSGELRILILEDVATDAELMVDKLRDSGLDFTALHVSTPKVFLDALASFSPNLILSTMLSLLRRLSALRLTREKGIDVPFLFVSGGWGKRAVELLRQGPRLCPEGPAVAAGHAVSRRCRRPRNGASARASSVPFRSRRPTTGRSREHGRATLIVGTTEPPPGQQQSSISAATEG